MTPQTQALAPLSVSALPTDVVLRPMRPDDLEAVTLLDRRSSGTSRRAYLLKRMQVALRQPKRHLQVALTTASGLAGFLLARTAGGEYGRSEEVVVLEAMGVDPALRHRGFGRRLFGSLEDSMRTRGVKTAVTQVDWRNHAMMKFVDGLGFTLAPRPILELPVDRVPLPLDDAEIEKWPPRVRHLAPSDLEAVVRIDRAITGTDRREYFKRKFDEVFNESAIEVSLVGEAEGFVVAFAMARVDFGDFGHVEPTAALDTVGVDPGFAGRGFGRAVLNQMVDNLAALHVERLETEVSRDGFGLLKFLYAFGFGPSQRLSFQRRVG